MSCVIFLDSGPLGLVTNPQANRDTIACTKWLDSCLDAGVRVCVPEICDYEVRRELIRGNKTKGLARLDQLRERLEYVPITTEMMRRAAEFWAKARSEGKPTASPDALDADAILAAQAILSVKLDETLVIATTNVGHLNQFAMAKAWHDIAPT